MPERDGVGIEPAQIAALREHLRLNQTQLGKVLETDRGHLSKLESGVVSVMPGTLATLLRWLFATFVVEGGSVPHSTIPLARARISAATTWDDEPELDGSHIGELRRRMGLNDKNFAAVLGLTYGHVYNLENIPTAMKRGSARVLLRWLYSVFDLPGGRPPHPSIPIIKAPPA